MNRKLIFLDIDGTLVAAMSQPSPLAAEAVQRARKQGHKVLLCTGRNMPIIGKEILEIGFDGVIASAGSHVEVEGEVLFDRILPEKTIQECLDIFHSQGMFCRIESPEGIYTDPQMETLLRQARPEETNSELIRMQKEIELGIPILPYAKYPKKGAYKICFTSTNPQAIDNSRKYLQDRFVFAVHPYREGGNCLNGEIIPKGTDKSSGMKLVCRHYGMEIQDTVAFGDSMNDYEMMSHAGVSVAMGNACREIKEMADVICRSVQEDGIYRAFRKHQLI